MIFDFFETSLLTREKNCDKIIKSLNGQVSEWFKELVLKTSDTATYRGFESHPVRHIFLFGTFFPKYVCGFTQVVKGLPC